MEMCLRDLNLNWCITYLDDIIIFLKDPGSHLVRLDAVFQKLKQAGLKIKPSKHELFHMQITYLVHIVYAKGIVTQKGKTDVIKNDPPPPLLLKSKVFLGLQDIIASSSPGLHRWPDPYTN